LARKVRKEDRVVFTYGGDGATSPGDFHEAVNFASIHKLPVVFVIENNLFAISTPASKQMSVPNVADRAAGYGIPGLIADGTDVFDVYAKTKEAADRARRGEGPSIVEAKCYRYQPHSSDDDDSRLDRCCGPASSRSRCSPSLASRRPRPRSRRPLRSLANRGHTRSPHSWTSRDRVVRVAMRSGARCSNGPTPSVEHRG